MFEEQVRLLRDKLMSINKISLSSSSSSPNNNNDASQITDLQLRLSERDAALKVLRDEIRSLQQNKNAPRPIRSCSPSPFQPQHTWARTCPQSNGVRT